MKKRISSFRPAMFVIVLLALSGRAPAQQSAEQTISPSRPIPTGKAPGMEVKRLKSSPDEEVYTVIFHKGDEALSGLVDFAQRYKVGDAHFTAIGAASSATLGWLDLSRKLYVAIPVKEQAEVASLVGDIAIFQNKPVVHMHCVLAKRTGETVGGHIWELNVDPTLEVFITVNRAPLKKRPDEASGMKFIDPTQ
jgi:predicted DNA-binding protein with PD1-like motif